MRSGKILLINLTGRNVPGLMTMLTTTLAQYQVHVLDIGQSVIHNELNLGILAQFQNPENVPQMQLTLSDLLGEFEASVRYTNVDDSDYSEWVAKQGRPRHIITMLARSLGAEHLAAIITTVESSGLVIDGVRRLSGRVSLDDDKNSSNRVSIELTVRGKLPDQLKVKDELLRIAGAMDVDCSIQRDSVYRRNRRLVAFDMDSTLIREEVIDELAKLAGVGDAVSAITQRAMSGQLDFKESFCARVALLKGLPETALKEVANNVVLTDGAKKLLTSLKTLGYKTAILSGGFEYVAQHLKGELGVDYVYANTVEIVDGVLSGRVTNDIVDAQRKADLLQEICVSEGIDLQQVVAIGDGANDLPMLSVAGLGVAFHAKPVVRDRADHAISNLGLDCVLYLMGFSDTDVEALTNLVSAPSGG